MLTVKSIGQIWESYWSSHLSLCNKAKQAHFPNCSPISWLETFKALTLMLTLTLTLTLESYKLFLEWLNEESSQWDLRQFVSSELSSQSLSPSQRQSLRAQRPFLHLNSLGSQGDGVPVRRKRISGVYVVIWEFACGTKAKLLTASELIASVWAVPLSVTDVVPRDALTALACGLIGSAGSRWAGGQRGLLDGGGCGGWGCDDYRHLFYI